MLPLEERYPLPALSQGSYLFIDNYLIAETDNLRRVVHEPIKYPFPIIEEQENGKLKPGACLRVIIDSGTGMFRMWYNIRNLLSNSPPTAYGYAESQNGINWTLDSLGIIRLDGLSTNNLFRIGDEFGLGLFIDNNAEDQQYRYKMLYYHASYPSGLYYAFSSDGLRFQDYLYNPVLTSSEISDIFDIRYNSFKNVYVACFKTHSVPEDGYKGSTPNTRWDGYRRLVGISYSKNIISWTMPTRIIAPDPAAPGIEEFYSMVPIFRGDLYIGLLRVLRDDMAATIGGEILGIGWTELITSRDGKTWNRNGDTLLNRTLQEGTWDHAMAWIGDCITVGNEEYIYYCGYSTGHKVGSRQIGMARLRKDGFVSLHAGDSEGILLTPFFFLKSHQLSINASINGEMRIRIINEYGVPFPGFNWNDCAAIQGDSINHQVRWSKDLSSLANTPVQFEIRLKDGQLYALYFD